MATDYTLSYTGRQINEKLGKIDGLVEAEERLADEIAVERARINTFTALSEGSTTGDAELADIRIGHDGTIYASAGEAVRQQIKALGNGGGLTDTASTLLIAILRNVVYTSDQSAHITALETALASSGSGSDSGSDEETHTHSYTSAVTTAATCTTAGVRTYTCSCGNSYTETIAATGHNYVDGICADCGAADSGTETEATLSGISATYNDKKVVEGTAVTDLTGVVVVATYSDGSTQTVTDYTLSGTIAEGSNIITVNYGDKTTTFTVTGVVKSDEIVIVTQPTDQTGVIGNAITFTIEATGEDLTYQWYIMRPTETKFTEWAKNTAATTVQFTCSAHNNGLQVYCMVTDADGASLISDTASVVMENVLILTEDATAMTAANGTKVYFCVTPDNPENDTNTYQWYIMRPAETKFTAWSGQTKAFAFFNCSVSSHNGLQVYCVITDSEGNTTQTGVATLTVV